MRVLYAAFEVVPAPNGRAVRAVHTLAALSQHVEVDALTLRGPALSHLDNVGGARLWRAPAQGSIGEQIQAFRRAMKRQLAGGDYDVVHCADPIAAVGALAAKIQHGFRLVLEAVGFPSVELRYTTPAVEKERGLLESLRRDERACLMAADAVIVGSSVTRAYVQERGAPLDRVRIVPAPVDTARFTPQTPAPVSPLRVVYAGSMAPWQGLSTLLFALRRIKAPVRAVVAAPPLDDWPGELARLARDGGIADRVRFIDPVAHEEVGALLAGAHAAVVPLEKSDRNVKQGASPLKLVEAMAAGLAVVASDLPLVREMVGDAALLFRASDERSLADRLARLHDSPQLRAELASRARAQASRFDAALYAAALREIYGPLLAPAPPPRERATGSGTPTRPDTFTFSRRRRGTGSRSGKRKPPRRAPGDPWAAVEDATPVAGSRSRKK